MKGLSLQYYWTLLGLTLLAFGLFNNISRSLQRNSGDSQEHAVIDPIVKEAPIIPETTTDKNSGPVVAKSERKLKGKTIPEGAKGAVSIPHLGHPRRDDRKAGDPASSKIEHDNSPRIMKCTPWEVSIDDWWQEHPGWEVGLENETHTCLQPIANPQRVEFLNQVFQLQNPMDASVCTSKQVFIRDLPRYNSNGFASTLMYLLHGAFWSAFRQNRPFQVGIPFQGYKWMYAPRKQLIIPEFSWAQCPTQDHECYFLPITNCSRPVASGKDETPIRRHVTKELKKTPKYQHQGIWLAAYFMRMRQHVRHRLYQFLQEPGAPSLPATGRCTWMHVRRTDIMTEKKYVRKYYPIEAYLRRGKVSPEYPVLLLTDDQSAIDEATILHPKYDWRFFNRTRYRGPTKFGSHLPSKKEALEVLYLLAETRLASQCSKGVFGFSNMAELFRNAMIVQHGGFMNNVTAIEIDNQLRRKGNPDAAQFVQDLDEQIRQKREEQIQHVDQEENQ